MPAKRSTSKSKEGLRSSSPANRESKDRKSRSSKSEVVSKSKSRGRSRSAAPTRVAAKSGMFLEKLCLDAIDGELGPHNTSNGIFYILGLVQIPVVLALSWWMLDIRFLYFGAFCLAGHLAGFLFSEMIGSNALFDVTEDITLLYSFGWLYITIIKKTESQQVISIAAFLWILRLLGFLSFRILMRGRDWRFDALIKNRAYNFFGWVCGGTWCWLISFCLLVGANASSSRNGSVKPLTWTGVLIAFVGLFLETISDFQKYRFRENNKSGFITTGLWSMSRHPNYLGEVTFWVGLCIAVIGALPCEMKHYGLAVALCVVSPGWSMFFLFFTSLMLLEKRANERWGSKAAYKAYKEKTPILLPVHI